MNFDINALKHHQLVEDGQLEGCYIHQPVKGSQQDDKAVLAERVALENMGYKVVQVQAKGGTTTFAEAMQKFAKKTGHQTKE
ncbi:MULTISPECIES: hypothetical protein [Vibrio]|jgi:hypothetical protein|uniref:Uncharacterized protein n=2 Tax=Vibrio cyclitrophicus TaxID=47951 RepID=A0A7Z1MFE2_9VIBR|nr:MULTISPECIES: hypothetical protein [Vibrio]KNH14995.1 hypothetical protein ACS79_00280 [Vibrio lentus]MBY7659136.1 hypothetical protein [Vibrio atlanticus]ERM57144.1 hypothetical protein M565_ctg5P0115 [Vibrio cyclitrophicus FF75]KAA8603051.1 hypothetical protein F0Z19_0584 [Vibrio cyclitrophicus]MBE8558553.1 hypothetical protein [Vibrio sp. OPT24]|tara:strand:- start:5798 stop:6043 length:246 start_codon:yes stop_codon:yes gene_type:complete